MDLEPLFYRLHVRIVGGYCRLLTPRIRRTVEYSFLAIGIALFSLLVALHIRFVTEPGCSSVLPKTGLNNFEVYQLKIQGVWMRLRELTSKELEIVRHSVANITPHTNMAACLETLRETDQDGNKGSSHVEMGENSSCLQSGSVSDTAANLQQIYNLLEKMDAVNDWIADPVYLYAKEKGFLQLSTPIRQKFDIKTTNLTMSSKHPCLGGSFLQTVIENFVGYDTIVLNAFLQQSKGSGYVLNQHIMEFFDLEQSSYVAKNQSPGVFVVQKSGIFITSLFLFFTASTLVSLCLRETQFRVFQFTFQLQYYTRHRLPCGQLILSHIMKSLVFVLVLMGILFFFAEFLEDQGLAFLLLTNCWICELYAIISVRTEASVRFFPRFFFLYFVLFHIYYFSFPMGFTYLAFLTMATFVQHLLFYFVNCHEIPALQNGSICEGNPRYPYQTSNSPTQRAERITSSQPNPYRDQLSPSERLLMGRLRPALAGGS
eukprot:TRINITY_DN12265_c0_g1_i1.p1 TRINITY_DN12265_c0_g1~~TRINITY_DN12265_c0_g1_i1.p1  ORF type:complete len:487 (+),score=77.98 TRINITY_DN12265_c0_g1_i1:50-1510(+)